MLQYSQGVHSMPINPVTISGKVIRTPKTATNVVNGTTKVGTYWTVSGGVFRTTLERTINSHHLTVVVDNGTTRPEAFRQATYILMHPQLVNNTFISCTITIRMQNGTLITNGKATLRAGEIIVEPLNQ